MVARAAELGQPGVGLTNHGHLYGAPRFARACREHGVKGVIGMEAYEAVPYDMRGDEAYLQVFKDKYDPTKPRCYHLTLWAQDQVGWENLCALHTQSFTKAYKPKNQPLVDRAALERHAAGLIVGLGCPQSRTNWALRHQGYEAALKAAEWYFDVFGGQVYVEVMSALDFQVAMLADQRKLAKHFGAKTVGTNDVHYLQRQDGVLNGPHHTLVQARKWRSSASAAAESNDKSDEAYGSWYGSDEFYMKTRQEMIDSGIFAAEVDTSLEILDRVQFDFLSMAEPQPPVAIIPAAGQDLGFDAWLSTLN